jgi:hypothetical protein
MKKLITLAVAAIFAGLVPLLVCGMPPDKPPIRVFPKNQDRVKDLMKEKLQHAQKLLEGIAVEDYDKIQQQAEDLLQISKKAEWMVVHSPRYELYSNDFRRAADELIENAQKHKLEAATLSYMQMTLSCVHCHKYVRETREARLDD